MTLDDTPDDDARWLVGYHIDAITRVVLLESFAAPITATLRHSRWATLIRGQGWAFRAQYLAHVERLLAGAGVDLFDLDGRPTPAQRDHPDDERERTRRILDEIAHATAEADTLAADQARRECRAAFDAATATPTDADH